MNVSSPIHQKKIEEIFSVREQLVEEKAEKIKQDAADGMKKIQKIQEEQEKRRQQRHNRMLSQTAIK